MISIDQAGACIGTFDRALQVSSAARAGWFSSVS
jgi:hypothetical protein